MSSNPFDLLVDFIGRGSKAALARAVNDELSSEDRVSPQAVSKWSRRIPAERVLLLERLSGGAVTRHQMRPDIFGAAPKPPAPSPKQREAANG